MLEKTAHTITQFNRKAGDWSSLLMLPMLFVAVYEVFMRYAFNAPTSWGFELTIFIYGVHFILGYSYTDAHSGHVRVDIFSSRLVPRKKAILEIVTLLVFFFPFMTLMTVFAGKFALLSTSMRELASTSWAPPIWPVKILMVLGFFLLWLQGLGSLLHNLHVALNAKAN
ncbi:TRAP transporter small permease subunit [Desulfosarcina sp.]|uniref:TRAP transporter small permease subunit n=1 Tax=Desulfosarcina sp. TaxID=2027861 RepID=UPI003970E872